jgi:hypothetical protein
MQVKIFTDRNYQTLERQFNEWVNDKLNVLKLKYSTCCDAGGGVTYSIAVWYTQATLMQGVCFAKPEINV